MRREFLWINIILTVALAACNKPDKFNLVLHTVEQKVVLNPKPGDILLWTKPGGEPLTVNFPAGFPCKKEEATAQGSNQVAGKCTIDVASAVVPYECEGCADPEIVVGSDISRQGAVAAGLRGAPIPPTPVYMRCDGGQIVVYKPEVTFTQAAVAAGASVVWVRGYPPVGDDWKSYGFSSDICDNGSSFQEGNAVCKLKTTLTAGTTTYNVSSAKCNATPLMGAKITITNP